MLSFGAGSMVLRVFLTFSHISFSRLPHHELFWLQDLVYRLGPQGPGLIWPVEPN